MSETVARLHRSVPGTEPRGRGATRLRPHGTLRFGPGLLNLERPSGPPSLRGDKKKRRVEPGAVVAWTVGLGTLLLVAVLAYRATRVEVTQDDLEDGASLGAEAVADLRVRIGLDSRDTAESARLFVDGEEIEEPRVEGATIRWRPPEDIGEGEHELRLSVPRLIIGPASFTWSFEVDTTPPAIDVPSSWEAVPMDEPVTVTGTVEAGSELAAAAGEVELDEDGAFSLQFARPPAGPIALDAVDQAGNRRRVTLVVPIAYPQTRSVHVTAAAWGDPSVRNQVLELADQGRIDAVQLDLKDSQGIVGFDSSVEQARSADAVSGYFNLDQAVEALHERGVRLIGRVSTFEDPILARHAWGAGQGGQVIQDAGGQPYGSGSLTNFAHPQVQQYNLDIALDAVERGVDEIVWDDVERPGGDAVVPSLEQSPDEALAGFLARAHTELRRRGVYQGVYLSGLSVLQLQGAGQDIAGIARHADYVVPVIHPSDFSGGNFDVSSPSAQPGEAVANAIERLREITDPSGATLVPSLQDRRNGYGETQVRAQIAAVQASDLRAFVLFSPTSTYTGSALDAR